MKLVIAEAQEKWTSPDKKVTIWDLKDSDGNPWQTMSKQIAQSIGQAVEVTTRVSDKGKTYLIMDKNDQAPTATSNLDLDRLEAILDKFAVTVERLTTYLSEDTFNDPDLPQDSPLGQIKLEDPDLPPVELYEGEIT